MFEIKMTIEIPGLPEALNALAGAIGKQPRIRLPSARREQPPHRQRRRCQR